MRAISNPAHIVEASYHLTGEFTPFDLTNKVIELFPESYAVKRQGYESDEETFSQICREIRCRFCENGLSSCKVPGMFRDDGTSMVLGDIYSVTKVKNRLVISFKEGVNISPIVEVDVPVDVEVDVPADVEPVSKDRSDIEEKGLERLSKIERAAYFQFWKLPKLLADVINCKTSIFDVDHANTIHEHGIDAITAENLQIVSPRVNRSKGKESLPRMTFEMQYAKVIAILEANSYYPLTKDQIKEVDGLMGLVKDYF